MDTSPRSLARRLAAALIGLAASLPGTAQEDPAVPAPTADEVRAAGRVIGIELTDGELELMLRGVRENLGSLRRLRDEALDNGIAPAVVFTPFVHGVVPRVPPLEPGTRLPLEVERPNDLADLVYADVATLSALVHAGEVSCLELAETFLARLKRLDEQLHCVITLLEERALAQARALDVELAQGRDRGPLHGIPWGAKDLLALPEAPTTWGARPFRDQVRLEEAAVVRRLEEAGGVLLAKLSLGALAWGDVWFDGTTRNPWKLEQGSSGSSAGSAAAVAAGCVPFAIGSETLGSIVSPSARCGTTSLRPTFGTVSRHGAMALSWSMDKLGPMARSARDLGLVYDAIRGPDPRDEATVAAPYADLGVVEPVGWRVGYDPSTFEEHPDEQRVLDELTELGCELVEVELPEAPLDAMLVILVTEAAEAFNELTLSGRDDELVRQEDQAWPNVFRQARLIPAVEYLRAQRIRRQLMLETDRVFARVEAIVHPSADGRTLTLTNLTGHPTVAAPCGFREDGTPRSISFTGRLLGESRLLALVEAWQRHTDYEERHPGL